MGKMSFNINVHSTLMDSETKDNLMCLFVGVANFIYYGEIEIYIRLHIFKHKKNKKSCY